MARARPAFNAQRSTSALVHQQPLNSIATHSCVPCGERWRRPGTRTQLTVSSPPVGRGASVMRGSPRSPRVVAEGFGAGGSVVELEPDPRAPVLARHAPAARESLDDEQPEAAVFARCHRPWTRNEPRRFVGHLHAQEPQASVWPRAGEDRSERRGARRLSPPLSSRARGRADGPRRPGRSQRRTATRALA